MHTTPFAPGNILVPLDGSPGADHVLPFVERLGAASGARVLLLRVIADLNPVTSHDSQALVLGLSNQATTRREAKLALNSVTEQLQGHGLPATSLLARGDPAAVILATVQKHRVDLIMMATQSRRGVDRVLFGSVADEVVRRANVPVMVVPRAALRWPAGQPIHVLVPLDGSGRAEAALSVGCGLATMLRGSLHLLHVCDGLHRAEAETYLQQIAAQVADQPGFTRTW
jgi:nucleotide-binding universal stress UspA family protein